MAKTIQITFTNSEMVRLNHFLRNKYSTFKASVTLEQLCHHALIEVIAQQATIEADNARAAYLEASQ